MDIGRRSLCWKSGLVRWTLNEDYILGGAGNCDAKRKVRDGPDAGVVMEVHARLATGAQACRDVLTNVTSGSGEDARIVCVNPVNYQSMRISES